MLFPANKLPVFKKNNKNKLDITIEKLVQHFRKVSNAVLDCLMFLFKFFVLPAAELFNSVPKYETGQLSLSFLVEWLPVSRLNLAVAPLLPDPHQPKS